MKLEGFPVSKRLRQGGFSVVVILIALVASLIVVGSVLAFTMSTVQSNTENVRATRLSQDMRAVMSLMTRELRRAGYDEESLDGVGRGTDYISPFASMEVVEGASGCFTIAYDRAGGTPGQIDAGNGELRAYRRAVVNGVGVMQMRTGANTSCQQTNGWQDLTDSQLTNIDSFTLDLVEGDINGTVPVRIRDVDIVLQGSVVGSPEIVRSLDTRVRVRADCIRPSLATCNIAPAP